MSYEDRINEIKNDPTYLKLKNKVRSNQENQTFQKYIRELNWLNLQKEKDEKPSIFSTVKVEEPSPKKTAAWRNQPKPIAWRNQNKQGATNSDVFDQNYEDEYNKRLEKFKITGKFSGEQLEQKPQVQLEPEPQVEPEPEPEEPKPKPTKPKSKPKKSKNKPKPKKVLSDDEIEAIEDFEVDELPL